MRIRYSFDAATIQSPMAEGERVLNPAVISGDNANTGERAHSSEKSDSIQKRGTAIFLLIAIFFGIVAGFTLDWTRGRFYVQPPLNENANSQKAQEYIDLKHSLLRREAGLIAAIATGLVAGGIGFAIGWQRGGFLNIALGILVGAVVAAAAGAAGGMFGLDYYAKASVSGEKAGMQRSMIMQATFWLPVAIGVTAAGLAVFRRIRDSGHVVVCSLIGAALATATVPISGMILLVLTGKNMKDVIPPTTLEACLLMGGIGTFFVAAAFLPALQNGLSANNEIRSGRQSALAEST